MIVSFRNAALQRLWQKNDPRGINPQHVVKLKRILFLLAQAKTPEDMNSPGYRLHKLVGHFPDRWSVRVSANWRLTFTIEDGDAYLTSTVPVTSIVARLRARGMPAFVSRSAGTYLCNAALYAALDLARLSARDTRIGFVHLPASLLVEERRPQFGPHPRCPLTWSETIDGGIEIIGAALGRQPARR